MGGTQSPRGGAAGPGKLVSKLYASVSESNLPILGRAFFSPGPRKSVHNSQCSGGESGFPAQIM